MKINAIKLDIAAIILTILVTRVIYKFANFSYSFSNGFFNSDVLMDIGICLILYNVILYILEKIYLKNK